MSKVRLHVSASRRDAIESIAMRLHGATVEACADLSSLPGSTADHEAVMVIGERDWSTIDRLLSAGMHVLMVAEPCPTKDQIEEANASRLSIVNPDRFLLSRQVIRRQLPGTLGEPGLIRSHRWEASDTHNGSPIPDPLLRDIDVVLWLFGRQPDRVYAVAPRGGRYIQVHLGLPGGGMALLDYDGGLPAGDGYQSLSVIAASGAAYADDHQNVQLVYSGEHPRAVRTEERARQLAAIAQEFVDDLLADRAASVDGWRNTFAVVDAIQRSLTMRCPVAPEAH